MALLVGRGGNRSVASKDVSTRLSRPLLFRMSRLSRVAVDQRDVLKAVVDNALSAPVSASRPRPLERVLQVEVVNRVEGSLYIVISAAEVSGEAVAVTGTSAAV